MWIRRRAGTEGDVGETKAVKTVGGIRSRRSQIVTQNPAGKEARGGVAGGRSHGGGLVDELLQWMWRPRQSQGDTEPG